MSLAKFRELPRDPGWKYEYIDGMAHVTPRQRLATVRVAVRSRPLESPLALRGVVASDRQALVAAYVDAFADSVEYCDAPPAEVARSAEKNIRDFYAGDRGEVLRGSCVAVDQPAEGRVEVVAGAALLTRAKDGCALLDMLFVRPRWQRRGMAAALVSWSLRELLDRGEATLRSRYLLANEPSRAWHQHFGFVLEPEPDEAQQRRQSPPGGRW